MNDFLAAYTGLTLVIAFMWAAIKEDPDYFVRGVFWPLYVLRFLYRDLTK